MDTFEIFQLCDEIQEQVLCEECPLYVNGCVAELSEDDFEGMREVAYESFSN